MKIELVNQTQLLLEQIQKEQLVTKWTILETLFNGTIPQTLKSTMEDLENQNLFDEGKFFDVRIMVDIFILYSTFMEKHRMLPKVFPTFLYNTEGLNSELVANSFQVKSVRYSLSLPDLHEEYQLYMALAFGSRVKDVSQNIFKHNRDIYGFVGGLPPIPFHSQSLTEWVVSHAGKTKNEVIHQVAKFWNEPDFPKDKTLQEMKNYIDLHQADKEWQMCKEKHPAIFSTPFSCSIENNPYTQGKETVRMLEPNDKLQTLLGTLTVCCQRLNSTGEASMIEGLINPDSGFLIFERAGKILAQSWVWLSEDRMQLVLDNIELVDKRKPEDILHLISGWVEKQPYNNIQMGTGYNKVKIGIPAQEEEYRWYKQHWKLKYTDAFNRVWLKKEGIVMIPTERSDNYA